MSKLTPLQEKFCLLYEQNGHNGSAAAIAAGYSKKTADVIACKLLKNPKIRVRIEQVVRDEFKSIGITPERIAVRREKIYADSVEKDRPALALKVLDSMEKSMEKAGGAEPIEIRVMTVTDEG